MAQKQLSPYFSIVIPVYNDWEGLAHCLQSIAAQVRPPAFEVIVVDDGNESQVPESVYANTKDIADFKLVPIAHAGASEARNHGALLSRGDLILFVDSDCALEQNCLYELARSCNRNRGEVTFQLRITGEDGGIVGRSERLNLSAEQSVLLRSDSQIRWLNTSGFAIRRQMIQELDVIFNPKAIRASDTYLLCELMVRGQLPFYVPDAAVTHCVRLSFPMYLYKTVATASAENRTYAAIEKRGIHFQCTGAERLHMLGVMLKSAGHNSFGYDALAVVLVRKALRKLGMAASRLAAG
jgi:glycosyltransferase involved in cell wall biosynthesis